MKHIKSIVAICIISTALVNTALAYTGTWNFQNYSNIHALAIQRTMEQGGWNCINQSNGQPATPVGQDTLAVQPLDALVCTVSTTGAKIHQNYQLLTIGNSPANGTMTFTYYCDGPNYACTTGVDNYHHTFEITSYGPAYLFGEYDQTLMYIPRSCPSIATLQSIINNGACGSHLTYLGDPSWGLYCGGGDKSNSSGDLQAAPMPTVNSFYGATASEPSGHVECQYNLGNIIMHSDTGYIIPPDGTGGWSANGLNEMDCNGDPTQCQWDEAGSAQ